MPCSRLARERARSGLARRLARGVVIGFMLALLAACSTQDDDGARVRIVGARVLKSGVPALDAELALRFSPTMLQALERGIPLTLKFSLSARGAGTRLDVERRLRVRYVPLAQQYQVEDLERGVTRNFARRALLLAWFDHVHLPLDTTWQRLPDDTRYALYMALDTVALPGPLRLPALISGDWRFDSESYAWTAGA
jgi:hypothetical protein